MRIFAIFKGIFCIRHDQGLFAHLVLNPSIRKRGAGFRKFLNWSLIFGLRLCSKSEDLPTNIPFFYSGRFEEKIVVMKLTSVNEDARFDSVYFVNDLTRIMLWRKIEVAFLAKTLFVACAGAD